MNLTFNITPVPASRPRVCRWGTFYQKKYTDFRKEMSKLVTDSMVNLTIWATPLKLNVTFSMPIPKSYSKKKREELNGQYCVSNMDLDNLEKALYDSMNSVVYEDDKQIVGHTVRKIWVDGAGKIEVEIIKAEQLWKQ